MTFHKYMKIKQIGHTDNKFIFLDPEDEIIEEEKIDGANFRFAIIDDKTVFGSHNQMLHEKDDGTYEKNFNRCIKFIKEKLKDKEMPGNVIIYGENCVKHSLSYDWDKIPPFLGFDIFDFDESKFMNYDEKKSLFDRLDLPMVPLLNRSKAKDVIERDINDDTVPKSEYASLSNEDQQAEGIVFKNYDKQIFAKYVREKFKEVAKHTFGGSAKYAITDNDKLVAKYCTNARIEKFVYKLLDEGNKLEMQLMKFLPVRVFHDIWEENLEVILKGYNILHIKKCRKTVTTRCVAVLKQMITNNALNNK